MTPVRSSRSVGSALRRHGIVTGLKYTQSGYTHNGEYITQPGVEITRQRKARYGGIEDLGYVAVYCVLPDNVHAGPVLEAFSDRVEAALAAEGLPFERRGTDFHVHDEPLGEPASEPEAQETRSETAVRAAAEVIAKAILGDAPSRWANRSQMVKDVYVDRAIPIARRALEAADTAGR